MTVLGKWMGNVVSHEASHFFGLRHTDNTNTTYSLIDAGGTIPTILRGRIGVGVDGIFGTADDDDPDFRKDFLGENGQTNIDPYFGYQDSPRVLANTLGSGKVGGAITGRVFNDTNRNGTSNAGETGLAGVTVFVDRDGDGILDTGEFSAITGTDGAYSLPAVVGTYTLTYVMPAGYQTSGVRTRSVTVASGASVSGQDFPIANLLTRTGTVFADVNGNRVRDNGEAGLERVLVYVDLNGDDKPGLSEPQTLSGTDGAYTLVFPGNGTYTVREVVPNGYVLTTPVSGEHTVTVTNNTTSANFDFGNRPARDYGDLPDSYGIASHGIVAGLTIGTLIDEDTASQFSATANGDDQVAFPAIDDEDGVQLLTPLAKGATATLRVTTTNSSSISAGLFAWADVNGNGTFENSELFINNVTLGTGTRDFPLAIPTNAPNVINTRFRYGYPVNQGPTGDVSSGEVEDHQFIVQATGDVAEDDTYTVSVNSTAVTLNVLANDFDLVQAPLTIQQIGTVGTSGVVEIAPDRRSILFTPAPGFRGQTTFTYVVNGSLVNNLPLAQRTATVTVNVAFQSATGIAVDDSFDVAENTSNLPLDVLKNDISGLTGNLTVVSTVNRGQGTVTVAPGGQAVIYSAPFGITGTEQFDYIISDAVGNTARATVTVHLLPGDRADDLVEFNIVPKKPGTDDILTTVQQGQAFDLEVYVRDTRSASIVPGVGSAYLDLLYPASLVSTVVTNAANRFGADISFVDFNQVTTGDARVPGIINEVGGTQDLPPTTESRPVTNSRPGTLLFRVRMVADQPGVAEFIGDPAENVISDTTLISPVNELTVQQLRFNRTKLTIVPSGTDFAFAKDDNFLTPISNVGVQSLDVLANDNPGPSGEIQIIQVTAAANGNVQIDTKGTSNPADDVILYSAIQNFNGTDQFTYTIQSLSGELSTATVTVQVGTNTQADDDVLMQVAVTDINGNDITSINVGETFKVRVSVKDLRTTPIPSVINDRRGVFAAYMDVLFNQKLAEVSTTKATADRNAGLQTDEAIRGFDVDFINPYSSGINSGDIFIPGVINDIGATQTSNGAGNPTGTDLLAVFEVTMRAKAAGPLSFVLDPASENPPFTDTLLFEPVNPVAISRIRYTADSITVVAPAPEFMNPTNRFDVNNDGDISPVDALMVINSLNLGGPRTFGSGEASSSNGDTKRFVDVNGDNRLTPIDALSVINQLNRQVGQAVSGESGSKQVSTPISRDGNTSGSSGSDENTGSNSNSSGSTGSSSALLPASTNSSSTNGDQDDDEDFFSDLASDVSQAWAK